jgi:hypothetical protein
MNNWLNEWKHFLRIIRRIIPGFLNPRNCAGYPYSTRPRRRTFFYYGTKPILVKRATRSQRILIG